MTFNARNEGEGGAYEAELYVVLPPEADYSGIARNNEVTRKARHRENPLLAAPQVFSLVIVPELTPVCPLVFSEPDPADMQL